MFCRRGMVGAQQTVIWGVNKRIVAGAFLPTGSREGVSQCLLRQ